VAGLACLLAETQSQQMARLFGAATATVEALGAHLNPSNQADYDHDLAIARSRLGDEMFEVACRQGRSLILEQAVTDALEE